MTANYATLKLSQINDTILQITLNRPEVLNAINLQMMQELWQVWQSIPKETKLRCIILTGAGEKAFCAGADLKARLNLSIDDWQTQHKTLQQAMLGLINCPVPVIAAVNGIAFGGGLELALASDFAYAVDTAIFGQSEVKLGIIPGAMGTQNLPRACGIRRAKELTFTGDTFTAQQAYEWGIVNKICSEDNLMEQVLLTAEKIIQNAPLAIKQAKKALSASQHLNIPEGYQIEIQSYNPLLLTNDRVEGITAFNEKRKPIFQGN